MKQSWARWCFFLSKGLMLVHVSQAALAIWPILYLVQVGL
jgi:hypothetical protein